MSDSATRQDVSTGSDATGSAAVVERQASTRLLDEADSLRASAITDVKQEQCKRQPAAGEVPVMKVGKATDGCDYQDLNKVVKETGVLNVPNLWSTASDSTVRIVQHSRIGRDEGISQGSGVAIGKVDDTCVVATARHVAETTLSRQILNSAVEMKDGNFYKYDVKILDDVHDRAVIAVKTGAKTDELCHPAKAGESVITSGRGAIVSYPGNTDSKYLSMARVERVTSAPAYTSDAKAKEIVTEAHTKKGSSGAPMFDTAGNLRALVTRGPRDGRPENEVTILAPVTAQDQRRWLDEVRKAK